MDQSVNETRLPAIPESIRDDWRRLATVAAEAAAVPVAMIVRGDPASTEVVATSSTSGNPYRTSVATRRTGRSFCEAVLGARRPVLVEDGEADRRWAGNADLAQGMRSFYGVPILLPDGTPFGVFCLMAPEPWSPQVSERRIAEEFACVAEGHLRLVLSMAQLEEAATRDYLTGVYNRREFYAIAARVLSATHRMGRRASFIEVDVDDFKVLNDRHGHERGDRILSEIAAVMERTIRKADMLARIGGDEFVIVAPDAGGLAARALAERMRVAVEASPALRSLASRVVTISCGVAESDGSDTADSLLEKADKALYAAKRAGRNQVQRYAEALVTKRQVRRGLIGKELLQRAR